MLLKKECRWYWNADQERSFHFKKGLSTPPVLVHYDPNKPVILASDAVEGVVSHEWSDGSSRTIAYASRTLSPAEKRYSEIHKESLAIIFSFKKK